MPNDLKYKPEYCDILPEIADTGAHVAAFCVKVGICKQTFYDWVKTYPDFKQAYEIYKVRSLAHYERLGYQGMMGEIKGFLPKQYELVVTNKFKEEYQRVGGSHTDVTINTINNIPLSQLQAKAKHLLNTIEEQKLINGPEVIIESND